MISIIVPIYNIEQYIEGCIQSLLKQTYRDIEILLIDDGSTDSSQMICQAYAKRDSRIKVFSKKNGGLSDARNYGLERARGEYFVFVDGDDEVHPRMLEVLCTNLEKYKADISVCSFFEVEENEPICEEIGENKCVCYEGEKVIERLIRDNYRTVVAWNKLYRREIFQKNKYAVGRVHEDEALIHHILGECGRIVYTESKLYYYKKRQGSITSKIGEKNVRDAVWALQDRMEFAKANHYYELLCSTVRIYRMYCENKMDLDRKYLRRQIQIVFHRYVLHNKYIGKREKLIWGTLSYIPSIYPFVKER